MENFEKEIIEMQSNFDLPHGFSGQHFVYLI